MQNNQSQSFINPDIDINFIIESMPEFVYWKNVDSVYIGCNRNLAEVAYLNSPQDIIGKTDYDFEWANEAEQYIKDDKFVIKTGQIHVSEYVMAHKNPDGLNYVVRTEKRPLRSPSGEVVGVLAIAIDITDRKEKERLKLENQQLIQGSRWEK